jgi:hypothetical protein
MAAVPKRKPIEATRMPFDVPDCPECMGAPIIYRIRPTILPSTKLHYKLTKHTLDRGQILDLEANDILAAYCSQCEQMIPVEYVAAD